MGTFKSITELAASLGVAPSTVSRALQDHPRISKETKDRVLDRVRESGFVPNQYARVLQQNKTHLIGVIIPDLTVHFFSRVLAGIYSALAGTTYSVVLGHSEESIMKEAELIERFVRLRVDGVLAALSKESNQADHFDSLRKHDIPLVFFDRVAHFMDVPRVISDDYEAAFKATKHLIKTGCKTIAHITASRNLNNSNNRLYGYLDALKANSIEVNEDLIFYFEFDFSSIETFLEKTLQDFPALDGIFVFNDYAAFTAVNFLLRKGIRIPDEISVIGFSNEPISEYMTPKLSTVEDVTTEMGMKSVQALLKVIETGLIAGEKIVLNQELVLKGTTK